MPRLEMPTRGDVGVRLPQATGGVVPISDGSAVYQAAGNAFGQGLKAAGQQMEADDEFRLQVAQSQFAIERDQLIAGLDDQDYDTYGSRYADGIRAARERAYKGIRSSRDRQLLDLRLNELESAGTLHVQGQAKVKEGDVSRGVLLQQLDGVRRQAMIGNTGFYIQQADALIESAIKKGYLDADAGTKMRQEFSVQTATDRIEMMPADKRIQALEDKNDKVVALLPEDLRVTMLEKAKVELKTSLTESRTLERYAEEERFHSIYNKLAYASGEDTVAKTIASIDSGEILSLTPEHQKALRDIMNQRLAGYGAFDNPEVLGKLVTMSGDMSPEGRRAWAEADIESVFGHLRKETADHYLADRNAVRGKVVGNAEYVKDAQERNAEILAFVGTEFKWATSGSDAKTFEIGAFTARVQNYLERYMRDNNVSQVPYQEFRNILSRTAVDVTIKGPRPGVEDDVTAVDLKTVLDDDQLNEVFAMSGISGEPNLFGVVSTDKAAAGWNRAIEADLRNKGLPVSRAAKLNRFLEVNDSVEVLIEALKKRGQAVTEENILSAYDAAIAARNKK